MSTELLRLELVLMLLTGTGFFLYKRRILTEEGRKCLTDIVTDVVLPCNIFLSFLGSGGVEVLRTSFVTVGLSIVTIVGGSFLGWLLYRRMPPQRRAVYQYGIANSNAIFIGMPIIQNLLGADGVLQLSMYMIFARVFIWTYGLSLYTGTQGSRRAALKKLVVQPAMIAAYLGIAVMLTGIEIPQFLLDTAGYLSQCLTAMSMLLVGTVLVEMNLRDLLQWNVWGFCGVRLALLPGLTLLLCRLLGVPYIAAGTCTLLSGMPAASLTAVLAVRYRVDAHAAASLVALSTVLSAVTIPVWYMVLQLVW